VAHIHAMLAFRSSGGKHSSSFHILKPRILKCRKSLESIPQHHRISSEPSDLRGTRGTQLGHLDVFLIADVDNQGLTPSICEHRKHFGNRHRVTTRGQLGNKGVVQKGGKGIESSRRKDHLDLHASSDPTSTLVFA
jgi:hypothetical protein